ncbi:chromosome partition protein Smc [Bombiscardovia apis]|uniref:Chromosome partition protein Smc n=1 Tax=Bombiscardovia apis TaxID=2932182 RepID=A0ABM8BD69_9BIFI|nr:chromosome segregation protein SMC [Bombiscardovia apis]BDR54851.1 chromosome partition protein Smc [Bombiscardovia apis]
MYLKELTLRGFKSFASATTLRFEPGITAVVGPNGSGKSNIVDALAWVMGEQGAKALRGTSMEDVIFAGTSSKPALGRAQVSLTIDNTDGTLDIDYTEVTITRTIFRNGGSEYAINGSACRLLDIQELLSDTGLGQQMHVIVGQGRLDAILHADPSGHRAFIEEAAGILKHRKRKERALRKLSNTETNLSRLDDLLGEIHRQLGPLGRQARVSRRADGIEVTLRDAQARIYAEDAVKVTQSLEATRTQLGQMRSQLSEKQRALAQVKMRIEQVEALTQESNPQMAQINQIWHDVTQLQERFTSLVSLANERARSVQDQIGQVSVGPDPEMLTKRAEELEHQGQEQANIVAQSRLALDQAVEERASQEKQLAAARQTLTELQQSARQHDAQLASLRTLVTREESALELAQERLRDGSKELESLSAQLEQARVEERELDLQAQSSDSKDDQEALDKAEQARTAAREKVNALEDERRTLNSQIIALQAKADALTDTLQSRSAVDRLAQEESIHVLGRLADFIQVEDGWEEPIAHALADYSGAMVVSNTDGLVSALDKAHEDQLGKAVVLSPLNQEPQLHNYQDEQGKTIASAASLVSVREGARDKAQAQGVLAAVRWLLARTGAVENRNEAQKLMASMANSGQEGAWDELVTREGDVFTAAGAVGGSGPATSDLALVARRDKALTQAQGLNRQLESKEDELGQAQDALKQAEASLEAAKAKRTESRLQAEQSKKALAAAQGQTRTLESKLEAIRNRIEGLEEDTKSHQAKLDDVRNAVEQAENSNSQEVNVDQLTQRARSLEEALDSARGQEMGAQLKWNEAKQQSESLVRQAKLLRDQAREATQRRERAAELNRQRQEQVERLRGIAASAQAVLGLLAGSLEQTVAKRDRIQSQVSSHDSELKELRGQRSELEPQVERLREQEHQLDVDRERLATQSGQVSQKISDDLGMSVEEIIRDYGPEQPVPVLDETGAPVPVEGSAGSEESELEDGQEANVEYRSVPYVREEQIKRLNKARKDLAALGKVNPLAAEEYESLKQRNQYLNDQRQDVVQSRDDLMDLVKDLNQTMVDVFKSAFDDTAAAFEKMFATLFPGGRGRLRLEDPDDLLTTGVLVEASPAGKKVRQLSLLSGGERSLTALALLFAIFTARPSPFYVMDEVEAALDDTNLSRLLNAFNQLREHAQLIIITHQQRTMSIADALYGVTMRADGITAVISQKLAQGQEESLDIS